MTVLNRIAAYLVVCLLSIGTLSSQDVTLNLFFPSDPPANPFTWDDMPGLIMLDVDNNENNQWNVTMFVEITESGGDMVAVSSPSGASSFILNQFTSTTVEGTDVAVISNLDYLNPDIVANQMFPPGDYEFCLNVQFDDINQPFGFNEIVCQPFSIEGGVIDLTTTFNLGDPPSVFADWDLSPSLISVDIQNNGDPLNVFLVGFLNGGEFGLVANTDPSNAPVLNLVPGLNSFNGPNALPVSAMNIFDPDLMNTGVLSPGSYDMCIDVVNAADEQVIEGPLCQAFTIEAQAPDVMGNLTINPPVSNEILNWDGLPGQFTLDVNNNDAQNGDVFMLARLIDEGGGTIAQTSISRAIPVSVPPGNSSWNGPNSFPVATMDIIDPDVMNTGLLPAGDYDLCIDIVWAEDETLLDQVNCQSFTIEAEAIEIMADLNINSSVPANMNTWDGMPGLFTLSIESAGLTEFDVLLDMRLNGLASGDLFADLNNAIIPELNISQGPNNFNGPQAFPVSAMNFYPPIDVVQILPAGDYEICIDVLNADDMEVLETNICATFTIEQGPIDLSAVLSHSRPVPSNMPEWDGFEVFDLQIDNNGTMPVNVKAIAQVTNIPNGNVFAATEEILAPGINVTPGNNMYTGSQSIPVSSMTLFPPIMTTETLPPGDYEICLDIIAADDGEILVTGICDQFTIEGDVIPPTTADPDLLCPILISPVNEAEIQHNDIVNTVFQWMPSMDADPEIYGYRFTLVEILEGQSLQEALSLNSPFLEEEIPVGENIFIWPSTEPELTPWEKLGWMVSLYPLDLDGADVYCDPDAHEIWPVPKMITDPTADPVEEDTTEDDHTTSSDHTTTPVPQGITTTEYPKDSIPTDSIPDEHVPPVPPYPPPETVPKQCNSIQVSIENGTAPSLGVVLEEPEKFKYPRAVALRAEGIDWDLDRFYCSGCEGGQSIKEVAVRDLVGDFDWTLEGKGQLNSPYDLEKIDSLQKRLDEIEKRLKAIDEELEQIDEDTSKNVPDAIASMEAKVASLEGKITEKKTECDSLDTATEKLQGEIKEKESGLVEYNTQLEESWAEYGQLGEDIDTLERYLDGEPGSNEKAQQEVIAEIKTAMDDLKLQLQEKEDEIDERSIELQQEIRNAELALLDALSAYNTQKDAVSAIRENIRNLESAQLADPDIRKYILRKREWTRKTRIFISSYETSSSRQTALFTGLADLEDRLMRYVIKDVVARDSVDTDLMADVTAFTNGLSTTCLAHTDDARVNCSTALLEVYSARSGLLGEIANLLTTNARFDLAISQQIDNLRTQISGMEGSLSGLESAAESAEATYEAAVLNFSTEMLSLENERNSLADEVDDKENELATEEEKLSEMRQRRLDDLDQNFQKYVEQLKGLRVKHGDAFADWQEARDSISQFQTDTLHMNSELEMLQEAADECKEQLKQLEDILEIAKNKLEELKQSLIDKREEAKKLEEEKAELEKERDEIKDELDQKLAEGNKKAKGPLVYYIPPPLEEILQNEEKFDSLKANVSEAEDELKAAYAELEGLQGKIIGEIEFSAYELVKLKKTKDQIGPLESEISSADNDLKEDKTKAQQEVIDEYTELVDNVEKAEKKIDTIKIRIQGLVLDSVRLVSEIESLKSEMEQAIQDLATKHEAMLEKMSQLQYEEGLLKNAETTHDTKTEDLRQLKSELEVKRNELARAQNDMSSASAQENEEALNAATSIADGLKNDIRVLEETSIPAKESEVASISSSVESAKDRVVAAKEQYDAARKAWVDASEQLNHETRDNLIKANEELKKVTADLEYWRRQLMIAQGKLDQRKNEVTDKKDKTDEMVNNQDDIKAKQAGLDEMKKQLEALKKQSAKSKNEIEDAVAKKEKWIKEAEKRLKEAREGLIKAKEDLHVYLRDEEFEVVDHKVTITLKARDLGVDGWRKAESKPELVKELIYPKKRTPKFENQKAVNNKPPELENKSICFPTVSFEPSGGFEGMGTDIGREPRTIALIYKKGEPLWLEWPVIPQKAPRLSMDVLKLHTKFATDSDLVVYACSSADPFCPPSPPIKTAIRDLHTYAWAAKGDIFSKHYYLPDSWWEPEIVPKPKPKEKQAIDATGTASEIAGDPPKNNHDEPEIKPGVMIEWTNHIMGKPDTALEVQTRVVQGDHKPLEGEEVEFEVELKAGASEGYGFGGEKKIKVKTDGDGYAKTDFDFGDGYAEYEFKVKWLRGTTVMQEEKFDGIAPLHLKFHKLNNGPPDVAWIAAEGLFGGGSVESALNSLPDSQDEENADEYNRQMHAVAGLLNGFKGFANAEKISFESDKEEIELDPEEDETRLIGIGRTKISGLPEDEDKEFEFTVTAKVDTLYKDVAEPAEESKSYSTKGIKEFYIGSSELPFLVETDEEFNPKELFSGSCHLKTDVTMLGLSDLVPKEYILDPLNKLVLTATDIKVEGQDDKYTAVQGKVTWKSADGLEFSALSFNCRVDSFSVKATLGADIGGNIKQATYFPDPIGFSAVVEPTGDFLGKLTNLPELSAAGFKLKQGSAFSLDMHDGLSPSPLEKSFKGVLIHTAQMELPDVLSRRSEEDKPSELAVKDFYIGTSIRQGGNGSVAFGGTVSYTGTLFEIGYAGYNLSASDISLTFDNNELTEGKITGEIDLPLPMAGKIKLEIAKAGDEWSAKPETEEPVTIPRLGTTFTLLDGTGITWNQEVKLGTLRLNAMAISKDYGEVRIDGFELNSAGLVKAENISVEKSIEFKGGFKMNLASLSFLREPGGEEYRLELTGGMAFPTIGIKDINGKLILTPGPSLDVELADVTVEFDNGPVEFKGQFSFSGREFKGQFDIGIKNVIPKGLSGLLIIGNTEDAGNTTYNYWYAELKAGVVIPLGQTGTAILEVGGGVGYNYNPPVGSAPGSPTNTSLFSFKAIVGAGNYPGNGNLFAGRLEMVLAAPVFTMYGKVWILDSEENIYGDGTLNLNWETPSVSGDLGMFIGLADADGDIFMFKGKIIFMYSKTETYIRSEEIKGSVFKKIKGEGHFDITSEHVEMGGSLGYSYDDSYGFAGVLEALIDIDVSANGDFKYETAPQRVRIKDTYFRGSCDIDLDTPFGKADILSGAFGLELDLIADPNSIDVSGSGYFEYDIFIYSGRSDFEVGYTSP